MIDGVQEEAGFISPGLSPRENEERLRDFPAYESVRKSLARRLEALNARSIRWQKDGKTIAVADRLEGEGNMSVRFRFCASEEFAGTNHDFVYGIKLDPRDENFRTADPITSRGTGTDCDNAHNVHFLDDRMPTDVLNNAVAKLAQVPDADLVVISLQSQ